VVRFTIFEVIVDKTLENGRWTKLQVNKISDKFNTVCSLFSNFQWFSMNFIRSSHLTRFNWNSPQYSKTFWRSWRHSLINWSHTFSVWQPFKSNSQRHIFYFQQTSTKSTWKQSSPHHPFHVTSLPHPPQHSSKMLFIKFSYRKESSSAYKTFRNHLFSLNFQKDYERRILNFSWFLRPKRNIYWNWRLWNVRAA
jgi:hypothetical protein